MEAKSAPTDAEGRRPAAGPELGWSSMENEVRIDSVPLSGELPDWLEGAAFASIGASPSPVG